MARARFVIYTPCPRSRTPAPSSSRTAGNGVEEGFFEIFYHRILDAMGPCALATC